MPKHIIIILVLCFVTKSYSQIDPSPFSLDYTLAPLGDDDFDFYKTSINFKVPIKLKKGILVNSVKADFFELQYHNNHSFTTDDLNNFYNFNYGLMYSYPINKKWNISAKAGISAVSNFTSGLNSDDLLFNSGVFMAKKGGTIKNPSLLMFGVGYTAISGKPRVLPFINYTKKVSPKFSFGVGFPNLFARYRMDDKNSLKTSLSMDGFYSNLSNSVAVDAFNEAEKALFRTVMLDVEYQYWMSDFWAITFKTGYSVYSIYELEDANNNTVYEFDATSKPYFSTGIKFNLSKKINKNRK